MTAQEEARSVMRQGEGATLSTLTRLIENEQGLRARIKNLTQIAEDAQDEVDEIRSRMNDCKEVAKLLKA